MNEATCKHVPALGLSFCTESASSANADPALQRRWEALVAQSQSPEAVFQTPGYFDFISAVPNLKNTQRLVVLRDTRSQDIVGVVPLRAGRRTWPLALGGLTLARLRLNTIALLGSVPLAPHEPAVLEQLFDYIFATFPATGSIAMQAVPEDSRFFHAVSASRHLRERYGIYIKDGWRACHTTPLPSSFDAYLRQFKAKKRYNIQRQLNLLAKDVGPLRLTQVDRLDQIPLLLKTMRELVTPHFASAMMSEAQYRALMERRIALCYLLHSGERPCAVVIGIRSRSTYHVHNIIYDQTLASYSPGTSLLHLATQQLIDTEHMSLIDYGYGDPGHSQQSSNTTNMRSQVFVYRRTWTNRMHLAAYSSFGAMVDWGKRVSTSLTKVLMVTALPFY